MYEPVVGCGLISFEIVMYGIVNIWGSTFLLGFFTILFLLFSFLFSLFLIFSYFFFFTTFISFTSSIIKIPSNPQVPAKSNTSVHRRQAGHSYTTKLQDPILSVRTSHAPSKNPRPRILIHKSDKHSTILSKEAHLDASLHKRERAVSSEDI